MGREEAEGTKKWRGESTRIDYPGSEMGKAASFGLAAGRQSWQTAVIPERKLQRLQQSRLQSLMLMMLMGSRGAEAIDPAAPIFDLGGLDGLEQGILVSTCEHRELFLTAELIQMQHKKCKMHFNPLMSLSLLISSLSLSPLLTSSSLLFHFSLFSHLGASSRSRSWMETSELLGPPASP